MNAHTGRTTCLRGSLPWDGIASGLCGVRLLAAAVLLFAMREVVGLTRLREMAG